MENRIQSLLCALNICQATSVEPFYPRVRDREDIAVLRCRRSGVIFLSRSDHMERAHYESRADLAYWGEVDRKAALATTAMDDERRSAQFREMIAGKLWLDVGTGLGGILELLGSSAAGVTAVEPQAGPRECLQKRGFQVYQSLEDLPDQKADTVTLFHVFEHFTDPLESLRRIRAVMKPGARIVIEVPHARDVLLSSFENDAFKAFTFWSEHLILHTRQSLTVFLESAGFQGITVSGYQRYPLANHLYWLAKGLPDGQKAWPHLRAPDAECAYAAMLENIDQTDTLIAVAQA
ncbi:MAG: class I SAM-dependent methyltransferase [Candidatus Omnitrophota bacterium]